MSFAICPLERKQFEPLFRMSDEELRCHRAWRKVVERKPGTPCRVSLADAEIGEEVLLLHYTHQPAKSPYHASHAIFVRPHAEEARLGVGEVPGLLRFRLISVRAYDEHSRMINADVVEGTHLERVIEAMFVQKEVRYLHLHNARPGCYMARVNRAV